MSPEKNSLKLLDYEFLFETVYLRLLNQKKKNPYSNYSLKQEHNEKNDNSMKFALTDIVIRCTSIIPYPPVSEKQVYINFVYYY